MPALGPALSGAHGGEISAAGDIASGALWARTVEPHAGEGAAPPHGLCLNCGTALAGPFCHACGQNGHVHKTLASIGHDLLHGVFHFEGKIWRTLPMLVLRPGELTRRYIAGERARFVSPLAMFLFSVFLMFASYGVLGDQRLGAGLSQGFERADASLRRSVKLTEQRIVELQGERAAADTPAERAKIDKKIAEERVDLAVVERMASRGATDEHRVSSSIPWLDKALAKASDNPSLLLYKVQSSGYKYSWALILLSTPLVALLFAWRRRYTMYDHAIFVTYSITFMSLLVILLELFLKLDAPRWLFSWTLLLGPLAHMFVQLRGAYRLSIFSAAWRTLFLVTFAVMALALFIVGLVALGVTE